MKFGKSAQEKWANYEAEQKVLEALVETPAKVFTWIPRFCYNTDRWVWLETIEKTSFSERYQGRDNFFVCYREIEK